MITFILHYHAARSPTWQDTDFREILFDPSKRRFSIIAGRNSQARITAALLPIIRQTVVADAIDSSIVDFAAYSESFIPGAFLKWPAHDVYTGLREEEGDTFSYVSILNHFHISNAHFKNYLATSLHGPLQVGTSWDAKLFYVGASNQQTVDKAIDFFHCLRVQMVSLS